MIRGFNEGEMTVERPKDPYRPNADATHDPSARYFIILEAHCDPNDGALKLFLLWFCRPSGNKPWKSGGRFSTRSTKLPPLFDDLTTPQPGLRHRNMLYKTVECTMILVYRTNDPVTGQLASTDDNDEADHYWVCQDDNMMAYRMALSAAVADETDLVSGVTRIAVSEAIMAEGGHNAEPQLLLSPDAAIVRSDDGMSRQRQLTPKTGTRSVLIVRCSSADGAPTLSTDDSAVNLFGGIIPGGSDSANLATQMSACSAGLLNFQPATGSNNAIQNGGINVVITESTNGVPGGTVQNWCVKKLQEAVGMATQWDHIYLILPSNVDFGNSVAFAYVNSGLSVYKDVSASYLMVMMHEIGHNMGMSHSGESNEYDDHTCMMGNPGYQDEHPLMCYNGQKSWFLGWYSERHATIQPEASAWRGSMVGVDDYVSGRSTSRTEFVVLQVLTEKNLYVMYNKAQGVNAEVAEFANRVTVVEGTVDAVVAGQSKLVKGLGAGEQFSILGSVSTVVIRVCSLGAIAEIIVYVDGRNNIGCQGNDTPTQSPPLEEDSEGSGGGLSLADILLFPFRLIRDIIMAVLSLFGL